LTQTTRALDVNHVILMAMIGRAAGAHKRSLSAAIVAVALAGCGAAGSGGGSGQTVALHGHPQLVNPVAGSIAPVASGSGQGAVSVAPANAGGSLPQPLSNAQIRAELAASGISANPDQATLAPGGLAIAPINAPAAVQEVIDAGNEIARLPYRWGGGHMTYEDSAYDCSGSLSFVLAAAGLLDRTVTSGELMNWGDAGPGKWITVFAAPGHTFAYIAGMRFDTVALAETGSRWSNRPADESNLGSFAVRHPPGL
jgi:cell wall-associated NlpC family hydrolase